MIDAKVVDQLLEVIGCELEKRGTHMVDLEWVRAQMILDRELLMEAAKEAFRQNLIQEASYPGWVELLPKGKERLGWYERGNGSERSDGTAPRATGSLVGRILEFFDGNDLMIKAILKGGVVANQLFQGPLGARMLGGRRF